MGGIHMSALSQANQDIDNSIIATYKSSPGMV